MNEVLTRLRRAGIRVFADKHELVLRGHPTRELIQLAKENKAQIMADLAEEHAVHDFLKCPECDIVDYQPLGEGQCRCFGCGFEWNLPA